MTTLLACKKASMLLRRDATPVQVHEVLRACLDPIYLQSLEANVDAGVAGTHHGTCPLGT